jgi:hypothetical protein
MSVAGRLLAPPEDPDFRHFGAHPMPLRRLTTFTLGIAFAVAAHADDAKTKKELRKEARQKLLLEKKAEQTATVAPTKPADPVEPVPTASTPKDRDPADLARLIDRHVDAKLAAEKIPALPQCTDAEFLRRAYLDLTGVIPTADKARTFLDSRDPDKRAKLIDELLADPAYGRHQADLWEPRLLPRESNNRFVPRDVFLGWLAEQFNKNTPWDRFVSDLVSATGPLDENPAVGYFLHNRTIDKLTDGVSRHFLGIQLQCAQCHNHPFNETKQAEYWGMAAFFSKVRPERPKNANKGADNSKLEVIEGPVKSRAKDFFPESAKDVPPKFLGGSAPTLRPSEPYRPALAKWMTGPTNPFFAKAMANRTWGQFFGTGIIDPVDDMDGHNPASHPELLDALAHEFVTSGFDVKHLIRGVCLSRAYQRSSKPVSGNEKDDRFVSHRSVKVMTPEQLYDSLTLVTRTPAQERDAVKKAGGMKAGPAGPRDQFVQFYLAGAEATDATEYEAGIPQALRLMNSRFAGGPNSVRAIAPPGTATPAAIEAIYLSALSRRPTTDETARLTAYVAKAKTPAEGLADVLWAVLNSSEFTMVR